MFGNKNTDIELTMKQMIEHAKIECDSNQYHMVDQMARWLGQDRRFDHVADKRDLASRALNAYQHGAQFALDPPSVAPGRAGVPVVDGLPETFLRRAPRRG